MHADDAENAEPAPRPPMGRPPRPPTNPPPPRRNRRRRRACGDNGEPQDALPPSPQPQGSDDDEEADEAPIRRHEARGRARQLSSDEEANDSPPSSPCSPISDGPSPNSIDEPFRGRAAPVPDWALSDDEFFGDADPPPPLSPMRNRPPTDWFSPNPSPPPPPPPQRRPRKRKVGNPNWVKGGTFTGSYSRDPTTRRRDPDPEKGDIEPTATLFFPESSSSRRRRPNINALDAILRQHLDIPNASPNPSSSESVASGFFPSLSHIEKTFLPWIRTRVGRSRAQPATACLFDFRLRLMHNFNGS